MPPSSTPPAPLTIPEVTLAVSKRLDQCFPDRPDLYQLAMRTFVIAGTEVFGDTRWQHSRPLTKNELMTLKNHILDTARQEPKETPTMRESLENYFEPSARSRSQHPLSCALYSAIGYIMEDAMNEYGWRERAAQASPAQKEPSAATAAAVRSNRLAECVAFIVSASQQPATQKCKQGQGPDATTSPSLNREDNEMVRRYLEDRIRHIPGGRKSASVALGRNALYMNDFIGGRGRIARGRLSEQDVTRLEQHFGMGKGQLLVQARSARDRQEDGLELAAGGRPDSQVREAQPLHRLRDSGGPSKTER